MIAVLQPAGGAASDGLEMGGGIRRVDHVLIGRRHSQAGEAAHDPRILDRAPVDSDIGPTSTPTATPDRQGIGGDVAQTEPLRERNRGRCRAVSRFSRQACAFGSARCCIAHVA